jgi:predicted acyltransferase
MGEDQRVRLLSLDAFRGLVIAGMIFVNFIHPMPDISPWLKHAAKFTDTITVPDLVFPGFLFITGVAIPMSLHARVERGDPWPSILLRIVPRAALLMLLGVVYEYGREMVPENTGISFVAWMSLFYLGVLLALNRYPATDVPWRRHLYFGCRVGGIVVVVIVLAIYRGERAADGSYAWIHHGWWGILGLIGWSYLNVSLLYLLVRGNETAMMALVGTLLALYVGGQYGAVDFLGPTINEFVGVPEVLGSISANVMIGALVGNRIANPPPNQGDRELLRFMLLLGAGAIVAGFLLRPLHGFSKIGATESYTLVTSGLSCLVLAGFYYAIEVRRFRHVGLLALVGAHPLLAYIVPDVWEHFVEVVGLRSAWWKGVWYFHEQGGTGGLWNAALVTALMMLLTAALVRGGVRFRV